MSEQAEAKIQISVAVGEGLRDKLEHAARRAVRSLSGEVAYRLQRSFDDCSHADGDTTA
jgi:hypothetical protein